MPERMRLNEKPLREAEPIKGKGYQVFDTEVRGFAICIYRSGSRAFIIDCRRAVRQRRMIIGRWPEWSTTAAREGAKDLIERYIDEHLPHLSPTNASDHKSMLRELVEPDWGNLLVTEITPSDVEKQLTKFASGRARPPKPNPDPRQPGGRGAAQDVHTGRWLEMARRQSRLWVLAKG